MEFSVFLDFNLPNAATWFYFSVILTVALFFQFARPFSLRNVDLLALFALAPGFLLLQEAHGRLAEAALLPEKEIARATELANREVLLAYAWLVAGSAYWFVRALADLALVRRPVMTPNLNTAGLAFLGVALFLCLTAVAVRRTGNPAEQYIVGKRPIAISQVEQGATAVVQQAQNGSGRPVSEADARFWVERGLAMTCHLAVVVGLLLVGVRHFQDATAGVAAATLYLLLPYTAFHIGQFHHVWPAAFLVWAVFCYRRPTASGWLLGLAAGSAFVPVLLFPLWFGFYSRRGAGRFAWAFLAGTAVSVGVLTAVLWWNGRVGAGLASALALSDWQPWKVPLSESLWTGAHWAYRLPIFVLYVAFLIAVTVWPSPKNLSHLVALSGAVLIGVQFWYADRGGLYVLWYLPVVLLMVLRPNLTGHEPPTIEPGGGSMFRWAGSAWRRVRPGTANPPKELAV